MRLIKSLYTLAVAALMISSCSAQTKTQTDNDMNSVIIYFTHTGNTELAAKEVAQATGAKMVRLYPEKPYTSEDVDWTNEQ